MRPADDLAHELRRDGARPFLTWYDDAEGNRVELSVATTANWVAKIANWLVDDADLEPGDTIRLGEPGHWLAPLCALAAWSVGAQVRSGPEATVVPDGDPAAFQRAVLAQPDALLAPEPSDVDIPAHDFPDGARVLSTEPMDGFGVEVLLGVLRAGGSLVLVANADPDKLSKRAETERVTHTVGSEAARPRVD